ncbi:DMT family transporter [Thiotrichales bacterium 19S3-7]|nr:DMT family transporter [Thiotrichales bacterium 19S3-7]MCF6802020.1 DMT family transporter [Thiotrichales bacterium 19S3-11]
MKQNHLITSYYLLILLALIWGLQFAFNSIALQTISPEILATSRVCIGAITLCILLKLFEPSSKKNQKPKDKHKLSLSVVIRYTAIAFLETVIPMIAIAWGQQYVDSSITGILMGTIPLFAVLLATIFIPSERATLRTIFSIIIGFFGLIILLSPSISTSQSNNLIAELAILFGALCFASSLIIIRTMEQKSPLKLTRNVLLIAAVPLIIFTLLKEPQAYLTFTPISLVVVLILGIFPSGIAYLLYIQLIKRAGVTFTSFVNYLAPLVSAFAGVLFMGDHLYLSTLIALILIIGAMLINNMPKFKFKLSKTH